MGIGVAVGVIAFRKITQAQTALGPEGMNRAVGRLADSVYDFADAVRTGMRDRESELRSALGVDDAAAPPGTRCAARPPATPEPPDATGASPPTL